jgi:hypothetical protein
MDWAEGRWNLKRIACTNVAYLILAGQALHDVGHVRGLRAHPLADVVPRIRHGFSRRFGFNPPQGTPGRQAFWFEDWSHRAIRTMQNLYGSIC